MGRKRRGHRRTAPVESGSEFAGTDGILELLNDYLLRSAFVAFIDDAVGATS
jgi:hypothetical protein